MSPSASPLARWYARHGRHTLPWRRTRDRWKVLTSEVMLHQTQVTRVTEAWPRFVDRFPTPETMADTAPGEVIRAWGTLGYPRRARWLWEAATRIVESGWPSNLEELPGVGRYTAGAVAAQADGEDAVAVDANIRRVVERMAGRALTGREADSLSRDVDRTLRGRDRLLALMDLGALVCRPRTPRCSECPVEPQCSTRGRRSDEAPRRQARYEGSFRQRRGEVLAALRAGPCPSDRLDRDALSSLVGDGLASVSNGTARLP